MRAECPPDERCVMDPTLYLTYIGLKRSFEEEDAYYTRLPAVRALGEGLRLHAPVTFSVGENGSGKSTLVEAIAVAAGFNPEGGTRNFDFATEETHAGLYAHMRIARGFRRERDGFFLRAESFYNVASYINEIDSIPAAGPPIILSYGGESLHNQSHGESFMALVLNRFGGQGLYILDEPEAALSPARQMALIAAIHELVGRESQFIIATHSPILMAYPGADIRVLDERGIISTPYTETEHYTLTRHFLENPGRMLGYLLNEGT